MKSTNTCLRKRWYKNFCCLRKENSHFVFNLKLFSIIIFTHKITLNTCCSNNHSGHLLNSFTKFNEYHSHLYIPNPVFWYPMCLNLTLLWIHQLSYMHWTILQHVLNINGGLKMECPFHGWAFAMPCHPRILRKVLT